MASQWRIEDDLIVELLLKNGFTCEYPKSKLVLGAIHFYTNPNAEGDKRWFVTNCPIGWNGSYTFPDGQVLQSTGTRLSLKQAGKE